MSRGTVSGQESVKRLSRLIGGDSEFTCVVLGGVKGAGGSREFIGPLREYLALRGIRVDLLSDFSFLNGHYTERFEELARDCVLGVLVLDGAGPEELYQFGFLRGRGKFILALGKDASGAWEAKGLRSDAGAEAHGVPAIAVGTASYRDNFIMRPLPGPPRTGWEAVSSESTEADFLSCLGEALPEIMENYIEDSLGGDASEEQDDPGILREQALRLSGYFSSKEGFGLAELEAVFEALGAWEDRTGRGAPSRVRSCLASLYSRLTDTAEDEEVRRVCVSRCVSLYDRILDREKPGTLAGVTAKKLADLLALRSSAEDGQGDLERAVRLYRQALSIFSREVYPREFTAVSNNLGAALNSLYSRTGEPGYLREAVQALEACVSQTVFRNSHSDLALVNVNLGSAYVSLALHEDPRGNYLKAAGSLEESLALFSSDGDPEEAASARAALGDIYKTLGDSEAESDNPDGAIEFYDRALIHYPEDIAFGVHASSGRKLGEAFERLYRKGGEVTELRKAIAAYSEALSAAGEAGGEGCGDIASKLTFLYPELADTLERSGDYEGAVEGMKGLLSVFDPAASPLEYALAQVRIGGFYRSMAGSEERELNTELAVDWYKEALSLLDEEPYREMRKELRGLAGGLLTELACAEPEDMNKRIGFYREALDYLSPDEHPREFARAQKGLGDAYMTLYRATGEREFPALAEGAFGEALRVFTAEEHAEERGEAEEALGEAQSVIASLEREEPPSVEEEAVTADGGDDGMPAERPFLTIVKDAGSGADEEQALSSEDITDESPPEETGPESPEESAARCEEMLKTVSKSDSPGEYASLKLALGRAYGELGDRAGDGRANYFRKALRACEESLAFYAPGDHPREYSGAAMGAAYSWMRIAEQTGDARGYERAIAFYKNAIAVLTREADPGDWGTVKENLGNIYRAVAELRGEPAAYRKALEEYKDALGVLPPEERLSDYGRIEKNIGFIHGVLAGLEDSGRDYKQAVQAFTGALRAYGPDSSPADYAEIQKLMGIALAGVARKEDSPEHYRRAIESWEKALVAAGPEASPKDYALMMKNSGAAYESLYGFSHDHEDLRSAAVSYEGALRYYTHKLMPSEYASITSSLGSIYKRLAETEDEAVNCRKAIKCCEGTLKVYNINEYPLEYAATQNNIGIIYRTLAELDEKGKNSKRAVNAYREALRVYTEKEHPAQYGSTKNNMGTAYMTLAEVEERVANCRMAVLAFEDALRVRTIQSHPMQFAATQNNLGVVYRMLSETEDRAKNCKRAIKAYEDALMVYTIDRFPLQYATTQNNIGGACTTLAEEEERTRNCDRAAAAYQEALRVFTKNSYPAQYGIVKSNLELLTEFSGKDVSSAAS